MLILSLAAFGVTILAAELFAVQAAQRAHNERAVDRRTTLVFAMLLRTSSRWNLLLALCAELSGIRQRPAVAGSLGSDSSLHS